MELLRREKIQERFKNEVVTDTDEMVKNSVQEKESEQLAMSAQGAVARFAAAEVGALGVGTGVIALTGAVALDITGITAALFIAGFGLYILPDRRRKARADFRERTKVPRERLDEVVKTQFDRGLDKALERMKQSLSPYVEFEHRRTVEAHSVLESLGAELDDLRARVAKPTMTTV